MEITVKRMKFYKEGTIGQMYLDGEFFCFTLEDVVREVPGEPVEKWKVPGETAIPTGKYQVVLQNSPHFGHDTPTLLKVPGFDYIRIHSGNTDKDTEGCLILGYRTTETGKIAYGSTRPAVRDLKEKLKGATGEVWLSIA